MTPNNICYGHRSRPCSAIIRLEKLPPAEMERNTETHNQTIYREWNTFEHSALNGMAPQITPSGFTDICRKRGRKIVQAKGNGGQQGIKVMEDNKESRPSKYYRTYTHMNSKRLWRQAQFLHGSESHDVPSLREVDASTRH